MIRTAQGNLGVIVVGERSGVAEKGDWEAAWSEPKRECRNE